MLLDHPNIEESLNLKAFVELVRFHNFSLPNTMFNSVFWCNSFASNSSEFICQEDVVEFVVLDGLNKVNVDTGRGDFG